MSRLAKPFAAAVLGAFAITFSAASIAADSPDPTLAAVAAGDHRSAANKARDIHRHPVETLTFFGLKPDMTVVEIWPGGGWYTEILAPYLSAQGRYYAAHWDPEAEQEFIRKAVQGFREKLAADPERYGKVETTVLALPGKTTIVPPGSADLVVTFRNIHNWMPRGNADEAFAAMYAALKPGGILGVVEHRGDPATPQDPKAASGYVNEDYAIALAEKAGFVLEAKSEINANPKDTKDHPRGVWTLPPTFAAGDDDREKYAEIGESDRFTLRFRKPE